jgi:hypothetical protein
MIKRVIAVLIAIALSFSIFSISVSAEDENSNIHGSYYDFYTDLIEYARQSTLASQAIFNTSQGLPTWLNNLVDLGFSPLLEQYGIDIESGLSSSLINDTFDYINDNFVPGHSGAGSRGTREEYVNSDLNTRQWYLIFNDSYDKNSFLKEIYFNLNLNDPIIAFYYYGILCIDVPSLMTGCFYWTYHNGYREPAFHPNGSATREGIRVYIKDIESTNLPIIYPDDYTGEVINPADFPTQTVFDPSLLTPEDLQDFLNELKLALMLEFPDYSSIESMLASILAILQTGKDKGLTAEDLQSLTDQLGCQCPSDEQIIAAILTAMASNDAHMDEVTEVLLDIREALNAEKEENNDEDVTGEELNSINYTDKLNEILAQLIILNGLTIAEIIDEETEEFAEEFSDFANDLIDLIGALRGTGEFLLISTQLTSLQTLVLAMPLDHPQDITLDLSFIGAGQVVFLKATDFQENGMFFTVIQIAKSIVSLILVYFWLNSFRKKYLIMMERLG